MKKFLNFIVLFIFTMSANAAVISDNTLNLGNGTTTGNKAIKFDTGAGSSNTKVEVDAATGDLTTNANKVKVGDGTASDKEIVFDRGGSNASIKWDETTDKIKWSKDGVSFKDIGSGSGSGASGGVNLLDNASLEDGVATGISNSGGTLSSESHTNAYPGNEKFGRFVSTVIGDYVETTAVAVPDLFGIGCQTTLKVKLTSGTWTLRVLDGSSNDLIDTLTLSDPGPTTGNWLDVPVKSLRCPAAGSTFKMRLTSTATGTVDFDDLYLGSNKNTVQVSGAGYMGKVEFSDSDCLFNTASATPGDSTDATCTKTFSGRVQQRTDNANALGFSGTFPKGMCTVTMAGAMYASEGDASGDASLSSRIYDATNAVAGPLTIHGGFTGGSFSRGDYSGTQTYKFASTGSLQNISLQMATRLTTDTANFAGGTLYVSCESDATAEAVTTQQGEWSIEANIGGGNPALGSSSVSSYTEITDSSLDMVLSSGSANAKIPCSSTNASTGLTCSAGNEGVGVVFTPPHVGRYEVCARFAHFSGYSANGGLYAAFQLVETQNSTQTIIQEGGQRVSSGGFTGTGASGSHLNPNFVCGTFYFSSASERTVRLMYEQVVPVGTVSTNQINADRSATQGQQDIRISVRPLNSQYNRPYLTGDQVTTPGAIDPITFSFRVSSTGVVSNAIGSHAPASCVVTSSTNVNCAVNLGSAANCSCSVNSDGECAFNHAGSTSTNLFFQTENSSGAAAANGITAVCHALK